jgi:predicted secreted protein
MVAIVTRAGKGSPLTNAEVDANFVNLNNALPATGVGDVLGPVGAVDNFAARYEGATGKLLQNSLLLLGDTGGVKATGTGAGFILAPRAGPGVAEWNIYNPTGQELRIFNGTTDVVTIGPTGNAVFAGDVTAPNLRSTGLVSNRSGEWFQNAAGAGRWAATLAGAESSGDAGSDFYLSSYTDAGAFKVSPLVINRATGAALFSNTVSLTAILNINGAAGTERDIFFKTANSTRWQLIATAEAESGANAGSNFIIGAYGDNGVFRDAPFTINRANGVVSLSSGINVNGGNLQTTAPVIRTKSTGGGWRWVTQVNPDGAGNAGGSLIYSAWNDSGYIGNVLTLNRDLSVTFGGGINGVNANFTSVAVQPVAAGQGGVNLIGGNATTTGYLEFRNPDTSRAGYIGYADTTAKVINIQADGGYVFKFQNDLSIAGEVYFGAAGDQIEPRGKYWGINSLAASYTLALVDKGRLIFMNTAAANVVTVPPASAVAFPLGTRIDLVNWGAGQMSVTPGAGVAMGSPSFKRKLNQYGVASLVLVAGDTWMLAGDLAA